MGVNEKRQVHGSEWGIGFAPCRDTGRQCNEGHSGAVELWAEETLCSVLSQTPMILLVKSDPWVPALFLPTAWPYPKGLPYR